MAPKIDSVSLNPQIIIPETKYFQNGLVYISDAAQLSEKLTLKNCRECQAQFKALLKGFGLMGYVDGSKPCPPATVMMNSQAVSNPANVLWHCQEQLVLHAILTSLSKELLSEFIGFETAEAAWDKMSMMSQLDAVNRFILAISAC